MERARVSRLEEIIFGRNATPAAPPIGNDQPLNTRMSFNEARRRVAEYERQRILKDGEANASEVSSTV